MSRQWQSCASKETSRTRAVRAVVEAASDAVLADEDDVVFSMLVVHTRGQSSCLLTASA